VVEATARVGEDLSRTAEAMPARVLQGLKPGLDALLAEVASHAERLSALGDAQREAASALGATHARALDALTTATAARLGEITERLGTEVAAQVAAVAHEARAGTVQAGATMRVGAAELAASVRAETAELAAVMRAEAAELAAAMRAETTELAASVRAQTADLARALSATLEAGMAAQAERSDARISAVQARVAEAAELVHGGGIELAAVAGLFSDAVDRYRTTTDAFLTALSSVDETAERVAREEALSALDAYAERTREIFHETVALQRELAGTLRTS
jgi:hypothetical protein